MNIITLSQILSLVGALDDGPGDNTARERFRAFLKQNVTEVGQIRDYVQECRTTKGQQFYRALQDLVNHLGAKLGFEIKFGRYSGTPGEVGFDGLWRSPSGLVVVVETKTNETYPIKTATLLNYMNEVVSEKMVEPEAERLGLYVVANPDPAVQQLHHAIVAEKISDKLRIVSVESLLSLAELMSEFDFSHADALSVLRPSTPSVDPIIELISRLIGEEKATAAETDGAPSNPAEAAVGLQTPKEAATVSGSNDTPAFWITPVKSWPEESAEECIAKLVGKEHLYAFGTNTNGRKKIKPGDGIGFYASGIGVIAHATVSSHPENKVHKAVHHSDEYPWVFKLSAPKLYLNTPIVIDPPLRAQLDAFAGKDYTTNWAWFVQGTSKVTEHDFKLLTGQAFAKAKA